MSVVVAAVVAMLLSPLGLEREPVLPRREDHLLGRGKISPTPAWDEQYKGQFTAATVRCIVSYVQLSVHLVQRRLAAIQYAGRDDHLITKTSTYCPATYQTKCSSQYKTSTTIQYSSQ